MNAGKSKERLIPRVSKTCVIELLGGRKLLVFVQITNFANVKLNLYYPQLLDNIVQSAIPLHLLLARKLTNTDSCGTNMQIFDTRGMRRSFDLPVFKEMAALGFAHLLVKNSSKYTISIIPNLAREDGSKRCFYQAQARLQNPRGRALP